MIEGASSSAGGFFLRAHVLIVHFFITHEQKLSTVNSIRSLNPTSPGMMSSWKEYTGP